MRIIGGIHKGRVLKVPLGLPLRPTTDFAKEALFNILANKIDFESIRVLDLFSGTGHISLEFASRGAKEVVSVDKNFKCIGYLKAAARELNLKVNTVKYDVFTFLNNGGTNFDLIFADPPYDLEGIPDIHQKIYEKKILSPEGLLIIEHGSRTKLDHLEGFIELRKYGNVNFSFFGNS